MKVGGESLMAAAKHAAVKFLKHLDTLHTQFHWIMAELCGVCERIKNQSGSSWRRGDNDEQCCPARRAFLIVSLSSQVCVGLHPPVALQVCALL